MLSRDELKHSVLPWDVLKLIFSFRDSIVLSLDLGKLEPTGFLALVPKPIVYAHHPFVWGPDAWLFYP